MEKTLAYHNQDRYDDGMMMYILIILNPSTTRFLAINFGAMSASPLSVFLIFSEVYVLGTAS